MKNEVWKDIIGYEGLYQISNTGKLKSLKRQYKKIDRRTNKEFIYSQAEKILKPRIDKKGYLHYALNKNKRAKEYKAHRLVAEVFIANIEGKPQINHKDMNKQNNCVENLEWCTNSENQKHSYKHNLNRKNFFKTKNPKKCI